MTTIVFEKNIMVPMRDGVRLATDVIRLDGAGPQPVLMARTPYNKNLWLGDNLPVFDVFQAAQVGYTVVVQDTRGRFASEGEFMPMFQERTDGVDAIQWAAAQPWSNGVVGMFGGSYVGTTQWLPAQEHPEALQAIAPMVTFSDLYEGMQYQGGAKLLHGLEWSLIMVFETLQRHTAKGKALLPDLAGLDMNAAVTHLPLTDQPLLRDLAPHYHEWLAHPLPGDFWQAGSPSSAYEQITVPALNIGGWYDVFLWGTLQNYIGMRQRGGGEAVRQHQRLIIGPWSHMNNFGSYPERDFGMAASIRAIDLTGIHLRWFDHWLKGIENGIDHERPVTLFVMGIDQWRTEDDWPLPDTRYRNYYLHSGGQANTLHGDGTLSPDLPDDEPSDTYLYNPLRPVPTVGGQVLIPGANGTGPRDQRQVEEREDVLVYTTPVLDRPIEVTGPVHLELFIASSVRDTDFTGKLVDVYPDGRAMILTEGILRARYHKSITEPELLELDTIYALRLDLWATSNVFLPGHRIRLEVSSSNFPRFARNTNTGGDTANEGPDQCMAAVNRIFHDTAHPSHLILPIIER
jgi:uncharacterized protein